MIFLENLKPNFQNIRILKLPSNWYNFPMIILNPKRQQSDLGIQQVLHGEFCTHH